jgi:anti-sigma regulatory factor (Ser/Thr protein kinase)
MPPIERTIPLPPSRTALHLARTTVREVAAAPLGARVRDAEIVVSELVANALRHGRAPITLTVTMRDGRCRIGVEDHGQGRPAFRRPGESGGWGLHVIERLADRWGVGQGNTQVWCELDTRPARPR